MSPRFGTLQRPHSWWSMIATRSRRDAGAAALEFALVLPFLLLIVYGTIELGLAFQAQLAVTTAAREGARLAAVGDWDAGLVESRAFPLTSAGGLSAGFTESADAVQCTVTFPYRPLILGTSEVQSDPNYSLGAWSGTVTLRSVATMRKE